MLQPAEAEAVVTLALMAALSDGRSDATEREQLKSLLQSLAADEEMPSMASIHQRVVLNQIKPAEVIAALESPEARSAAFEIAVCVVDADGKTTAKEQDFLDDLEKRLGLSHTDAVAFEREAESIALADPTDGREIDLFVPELPRRPAPAPAPAVPASPDRAESDRIILRYAVLNGALELLPQISPRWRSCPSRRAWSTPSATATAIRSVPATSRSSSPRSASGRPLRCWRTSPARRWAA